MEHDPRVAAGDPDARWWAYNIATYERKPIKAAEASNYYKYLSIEHQDVAAYFENRWGELIQVEGDPNSVAPPPEPEEDTSIMLVVEFQTEVNPKGDVEDAINEALEAEGVDFESMGSNGWSADQSQSTLALNAMRRGLKKALPREDWAFVEITKLGPKDDQRRTFGLAPTPRKKPSAG